MKPKFTENILDAPLDETVCWCSGVSKRAILYAMKNGAQCMDDIRLTTRACTAANCKEFSPRGRCCSKEIKELLDTDIV